MAKAPPDGHTLVMGNIGTHAVNPFLMKSTPFDPLKDFVPIAHVLEADGLLVVHPSLPVKTVPELIRHAKVNPGKLSYASGGVGGPARTDDLHAGYPPSSSQSRRTHALDQDNARINEQASRSRIYIRTYLSRIYTDIMTSATALRAVRRGNGEGTPLWRNVSSLILRRIRKGQYAVGHLLPREVDLADEFQVSRNTVREAIRLLADDGLLLRRKRAGTLVVSSGSEGPLRFNVDQLRSFDRLIESSWIRVLKRDRAPLPPSILRSYPEAERGKWPRVTALRQSIPDHRNLFSSEIYLHPRLENFESLVQHARGALFALIEQRTGERIARVDSVVRACVVRPAIARLLGVLPGSPALHISRRMVTKAGELLEIAETVLPESRYEFEISFFR